MPPTRPKSRSSTAPRVPPAVAAAAAELLCCLAAPPSPEAGAAALAAADRILLAGTPADVCRVPDLLPALVRALRSEAYAPAAARTRIGTTGGPEGEPTRRVVDATEGMLPALRCVEGSTQGAWCMHACMEGVHAASTLAWRR